ncbi:hypothetical protein FNV43_RR17049 [Rhamnella rubrinervis]|uniref:Uncharacterized protein n=1 Tax=Rhamnella rubrinervis TaxID=2594499 RepID=A0A8K0H014_9ROSA|nr:hypothetical protein FNV43_RR17049 [Rhamnella rubrinervis]
MISIQISMSDMHLMLLKSAPLYRREKLTYPDLGKTMNLPGEPKHNLRSIRKLNYHARNPTTLAVALPSPDLFRVLLLFSGTFSTLQLPTAAHTTPKLNLISYDLESKLAILPKVPEKLHEITMTMSSDSFTDGDDYDMRLEEDPEEDSKEDP